MHYIDSNKNRIAYHRSTQDSELCVLFCGGFKSSMEGSKALALEQICQQAQLDFTRFDYSGHGSSDGDFIEGNIDSWLHDTQCIIDLLPADKNIILVGSSMGAWLATLSARNNARRVTGLITIAAAPDFTERLLLPALNAEQLSQLKDNKPVLLPSEYDDGSPYPITSQLIGNSRKHCLLDANIEVTAAVRMLHGTADEDVPYQLSIELMGALQSDNVQLQLIKHGDHRLSSSEHLKTLEKTLTNLVSDLG